MVQKHFEGRKRPDIQGEMDKYAGYLFCGECGSRLYLHRAFGIDPEKNFFQCGGYQTKGKSHCTAHYISESVVDAIVLANGEIVEQGNHDQLLAVGGRYFELHQLMLDEEKLRQA